MRPEENIFLFLYFDYKNITSFSFSFLDKLKISDGFTIKSEKK